MTTTQFVYLNILIFEDQHLILYLSINLESDETVKYLIAPLQV